MTEINLDELRIGDRVQGRHRECLNWVGTIVNISGSGRQASYSVNFERNGILACQKGWLWKWRYDESRILNEQAENGKEDSETDSQSSSDTEERSGNDDDNESHVSEG